MPPIPGVNHRRAVRAFERGGFRVIREGKHIVMSNSQLTIVIPRNDPVNSYTMAGIVLQAGLTIDEFMTLL
ncbi:MAG: hypothetical protein C0506_00960 [Anaerolinea sp.]|nr:hypothetical protein [Anaerolinea sp.]